MLVSPSIVQNKRQHLRRNMAKPAALHLGGATFCQGKTLNVSNGGVSMCINEGEHELTEGKNVNLWMSVDESIERISSKNGKKIPGHIVRVSEVEVAVKFDNPSDAHAQLNAILLANI